MEKKGRKNTLTRPASRLKKERKILENEETEVEVIKVKRKKKPNCFVSKISVIILQRLSINI